MQLSFDIIKQCVRQYAARLDAAKVGEVLNTYVFYLAGGSLSRGTPNDFDIFSVGSTGKFNLDRIKLTCKEKGYGVVSHTQNALTVMIGECKVQFCNYYFATVNELVRNFDFAHCQICAEFTHNDQGTWYVDDIYYTDEWKLAKMAETTFYTGSDFPLSSLVRAGKFLAQGKYASRGQYKKDVVKIVKDVVSRGFKNRDDYIRQLESISENLFQVEGAEELCYLLMKEQKEEPKK